MCVRSVYERLQASTALEKEGAAALSEPRGDAGALGQLFRQALGEGDAVHRALCSCDRTRREHHGPRLGGALHLAAEQSRAPLVELLLRHGAEANVADHRGRTPLHLAFAGRPDPPDRHRRRLRVVELLLDGGADVDARDHRGDTPLHRLLHSMEAQRRPAALARLSLDDAAHAESASALLAAGAATDALDGRSRSPLQLAVRLLSLGMVELLLEHGARVAPLRLDEVGFCYAEHLVPSLEATNNLLNILDKLSSHGLPLDARDHLAVLGFLVGNHVGCRYDLCADGNAAYKLNNLLELGTDENIVAALAKLPLDMYDASFEGQSMKKRMVQQLCEHAVILDRGGFYVSNEVREGLNSKIASLERCILKVIGPCRRPSALDLLQFEAEFRAMRATALNASTSLHDVLTMSPRKLYYYIKNYGYEVSQSSSAESYPRCGGIIRGHFAKSLVRRYVTKSSTEYFRHLIGLPLPDLCCDRILDFLDNDNLLNLCIAAAELNF
ncbi:serine/threonine-protein phosphatase 6 regulatory ankyrin repeat subunit A-like [Phymastichus coffea]|uniref:serine/threonine-protein phosphatase 6 regulatory ankyrin repeat subunit A-like n=1 Tax=Phymastichus coffea TaxID=108790 RepID=UPI00273B2381|nr:serine/threonine-protein phosphatase 6 regulatory ankyrin repeat subunit A-like [Phymastichus coffea]